MLCYYPLWKVFKNIQIEGTTIRINLYHSNLSIVELQVIIYTINLFPILLLTTWNFIFAFLSFTKFGKLNTKSFDSFYELLEWKIEASSMKFERVVCYQHHPKCSSQ